MAFGYGAIVCDAVVALLVAVAAAIALGPYRLAPRDLLAFLIAKATGAASPLPAPAETVILQIRLPRVLAAVEPRSSAGGPSRALPSRQCRRRDAAAPDWLYLKRRGFRRRWLIKATPFSLFIDLR